MTEIIVAAIALCSGFTIRHFWPVRRVERLPDNYSDCTVWYVWPNGVVQKKLPRSVWDR